MKMLLMNAMLMMHGREYRVVELSKVQTPEKAWKVTVVNRVTGCEGTYRTNKWRQMP